MLFYYNQITDTDNVVEIAHIPVQCYRKTVTEADLVGSRVQ